MRTQCIKALLRFCADRRVILTNSCSNERYSFQELRAPIPTVCGQQMASPDFSFLFFSKLQLSTGLK